MLLNFKKDLKITLLFSFFKEKAGMYSGLLVESRCIDFFLSLEFNKRMSSPSVMLNDTFSVLITCSENIHTSFRKNPQTQLHKHKINYLAHQNKTKTNKYYNSENPEMDHSAKIITCWLQFNIRVFCEIAMSLDFPCVHFELLAQCIHVHFEKCHL